MKKVILLFIAVLSVSIAIAQTKNTVVTNLSSERFKAIIANDKGGTIIDLRTTEELEKKGYIKGAGGGRSSEAAAYMEKNGFKRVYTLEKGLSEWLQKGFPVEKK